MPRLSTSNKINTNHGANGSPSPIAQSSEHRFELFTRITSAISSDLDLEKTLYAIVDEVFNYFKPRGASIMVKNGDKIQVVAGRSISHSPGSRQKPQDLPSFNIGDGVAGTAALIGKPVWINDTLLDARFVRFPGKTSKTRAILAVPMKIHGRVTGVINVSFAEPRQFSEEDIGILQVIATPAAYSIQNANLFQRINEERTKLQLIQDSMKGGMSVSKPDGTMIFMNEAGKEMFGIKSDVIGLSPFTIMKNLRNYVRADIKLHFSIPEVIAAVVRGKAVTGMIDVLENPVRHVEAIFSPVRGTDGKVIALVGNYRDVTELVNQSEQIKRQLSDVESEQDRWKAIFENVEEAILVINTKNGCIEQANPATEILSGFDQNKIIGKKFDEVFPIKNQRNVPLTGDVSPIATVVKTKEPIEYMEGKFVNTEDREVWIGLSLTPVQIRNDDPQDDQVIVVMRDISRLKEIDQAKSDFLSMASHELRTPLTVINGYISLFMSGELGEINKPELAHFRQVISQIQKNTERLNRLVEDLLNVSRIEQGRLNLNIEKLNLEILVKEVVEEMRHHAESRGHRLNYSEPLKSFLSFPLIVKADRDKIREILINLIDNAIKYTPNNGLIELAIHRSGKEVVVSIKDSGPGIPKQLVPRIFEKFQRLEGSYVKEAVGTGLGLYIVRELLRAHGGRVWVESQVGLGTTFFFSLPLYKD